MRRGRRRGGGKISITIIVLALLVVMSVQIFRLKEKDKELQAREQAAQELYEQETQRAEEIKSLADYMNTKEYIEDVAKSKLGLAYDDEIIFKEKTD